MEFIVTSLIFFFLQQSLLLQTQPLTALLSSPFPKAKAPISSKHQTTMRFPIACFVFLLARIPLMVSAAGCTVVFNALPPTEGIAAPTCASIKDSLDKLASFGVEQPKCVDANNEMSNEILLTFTTLDCAVAALNAERYLFPSSMTTLASCKNSP